MAVSWEEKIEKFYSIMKERGYKVELDQYSVDPFNYILRHIVTKDNYYHVAIEERMITEAPIGYTVNFVEKELKRLKENS